MLHAWGMTETSPIVTTGAPLYKHADLDGAALVDMQVRQGRQVFGVELKLVGRDGETLPHDGVSVGELKVRGNWVDVGLFQRRGRSGASTRTAGLEPATSPRSTPTVTCSSPTG